MSSYLGLRESARKRLTSTDEEPDDMVDTRPAFAHQAVPFNPALSLLLPKRSLPLDHNGRTPYSTMAELCGAGRVVLNSEDPLPRLDPRATPPYELDESRGEERHQLPGLTSRDKSA
ncbi:hypothetical protein MAPG_01019 [Magnaporthiopsis poae ATCC 64411]|uniref:Uncharacterized protein n=1 Tax=Magnaporthiopsis poae (strain ATCC 64411 / 73-15) TaxID=644358 RepID=A0A0C4DML0_MAGP6|nr:hypothetical protein MAPG_01019 [Magnaporthiopsis poae ATCC 64411]